MILALERKSSLALGKMCGLRGDQNKRHCEGAQADEAISAAQK